MLLTRQQFHEQVFKRDGAKCVVCRQPAVDAHHIFDRKLFPDGGYYLNNGVALCEEDHCAAERGVHTPMELVILAGIPELKLPDDLDPELRYDKWGQPLKGYIKYPKTLHLPWSPNLQNDDRMLPSTECFEGKKVVVTLKLDGENTTMYRDHIHARSMNSLNHPSRTFVKGLWGGIAHEIPEGWRVCGENMYAMHSIHYHNLSSYFYVFSIWNSENICLSWIDTIEYAALLGFPVVPVLGMGTWKEDADFKIYEDSVNLGFENDECEGYVVRLLGTFKYEDFDKSVAKYVRKGHVQTDEHWMTKPVIKNELRKV